jgi:hypothetical protein
MNTKIRALLALPLAFSLACDDLPPGAVDIDDDGVAVRDTTLAAAIAQHTAFRQLSARAWVRLGNVLTAKSTLSAEQLEVQYARIERCRDMSSPICVEVLENLTLNAPQTQTELTLRDELNAVFHLDQLPVPERTVLLRDAQALYIAGGGTPPPLSLVPSTFESGAVTCDAGCKATVLDGLDTAHGGMLARLSSTDPYESGDGGDDGGSGGAWTEILIELAVAAGIAAIACLKDPDCYLPPFEFPPKDKECTDNGDCLDSEYCWKGPLGIGENECRDLKENGQNCGNDDACESGCCNFNLFGSECAVPSKCN